VVAFESPVSSDQEYKLRIMIVEDNLDIASTYRIALTKKGFAVAGVVAKDAVRQFRELASTGEEPDIVILDRWLPDGDSLYVERELLDIDPTIIIILATSDTFSEKELRLIGIKGALRKPFGVHDLLAEISLNPVKECESAKGCLQERGA